MILPLPSQDGHGLPSSRWPVPLHSGQIASPLPGAPGAASSPGAAGAGGVPGMGFSLFMKCSCVARYVSLQGCVAGVFAGLAGGRSRPCGLPPVDLSLTTLPFLS
jgi:hypothetical protein